MKDLKGETPHEENQGGGKLTPLLTTQLAPQVTVGAVGTSLPPPWEVGVVWLDAKM